MGWSAGRHVDHLCGGQTSPWPAGKVIEFGPLPEITKKKKKKPTKKENGRKSQFVPFFGPFSHFRQFSPIFWGRPKPIFSFFSISGPRPEMGSAPARQTGSQTYVLNIRDLRWNIGRWKMVYPFFPSK